jgi:hypothetical protein
MPPASAASPAKAISASWRPVNGSVSGLASTGRSTAWLAPPELAESDESLWLAFAGAPDALCALTPALSFAAEAALDAPRAAAVPELELDCGAEADWRGAPDAAGAELAGAAGAGAAGAGAAAGGFGAGA